MEPPATSIDELVVRLAAMRAPGSEKPLLSDTVKKFNAHQVVSSFKFLMEEHGLLKTEERAVGETHATFTWRPAFENIAQAQFETT